MHSSQQKIICIILNVFSLLKCCHGNCVITNYCAITNDNVFYVTFHLLNIKTQTMCQIEVNLFFFNMVVLRYQNIYLLYALFA